MLLLDLKPQLTNICDCLTSSLVHAAIYFERDYQYLFKGIWVFNFEPTGGYQKNQIWEGIGSLNLASRSELLRKYHGVQLVSHRNGKVEEFLAMAELELTAQRPLMIEFAINCCPWAGVYQQESSWIHNCLVIGWDFRKQEFICADPYVTPEIMRLPMEDLLKGYYVHHTFEIGEPEANFADWRRDLETLVEYNYQKRGQMNSFEMIRCLAEEISQSADFLQVMDETNIYSSELFFLLKFMTYSRLNYSWFLKFIGEKCSVTELASVASQMEEASSIWRLVWLKLTKITYMPDKSLAAKTLNGIQSNIHKVADLEEAIAQSILRLI